MCGGNLVIWRSENALRSYAKGNKSFADNSMLPEELQKNSVDLDKNGVPDYIDDLVKSATSGGDSSVAQKYSQDKLRSYNADANGNGIPDRGE